MMEMTMNQGLAEKTEKHVFCAQCGEMFYQQRKFENLCKECQRKKEDVMMVGAK